MDEVLTLTVFWAALFLAFLAGAIVSFVVTFWLFGPE
jgi:hypothetical protein